MVAGTISCVVEFVYTYTMVMLTDLLQFCQAALRIVELIVSRYHRGHDLDLQNKSQYDCLILQLEWQLVQQCQEVWKPVTFLECIKVKHVL